MTNTQAINKVNEAMTRLTSAPTGQVIRVCAGFYMVKDSDGVIWDVVKNSDLEGQLKWIAYNRSSFGENTEAFWTKELLLSALLTH